MTYQECVDYILSIPLFAAKLGTDCLFKILDIMEHPEKSCLVVHVAGTNGKGSTCSFLASILQEAGFRVGVFTSPHLIKLNERIRINKHLISNEDFLDVFHEVMNAIALAKKQGIPHPSFFEFMFLMAAVYFRNQKVDYVIYETGMGGRLDATNVVEPVLTIITSVGMDHMQYLGDTISAIAMEKAGIMKKDVPALYYDRKDEASEVIEEYALQVGANLHSVENFQHKLLKINKKAIDFSFKSGYYEYGTLSIQTAALYQVENAVLAVRAYELLTEIENACGDTALDNIANPRRTDIDCVRAGLWNMFWPGRMECIAPGVYVDGAHNEEAINAFCNTLDAVFSKEEKILLFAVSKDKDYEPMIERLCKISFQEIILVRYTGDRSAALETVEGTFRRFSKSRITVFDDIREGFSYGKGRVGDKYLFCVGSLYLAGELLQLGV